MLDIGDFRSRTCSGITRRSFLRLGSSLPMAWALPGSLQQAAAAESPRAKSVLFVFLWGAPSQLDTFDPKPNAPVEYRGPFGVIPTRTPGVHFTELLPRMAARSDRFSLVRSNVAISSSSGHPKGGTVALTGFEEQPEPVQPTFGSIIAKHRGQTGYLPPFFSLANGKLTAGGAYIKGDGGGTLSTAHDPFMVGCSQQGEVDIPTLKVLQGLAPNRISDRKTLLNLLDKQRAQLDSSALRKWQRTYRSAYDLLMNPKARGALDLTRESPATRARYGHSQFGQSALLARRLVEAEVPYIQLNYSRDVDAFNPGYEIGWDTHIYNFELLQDQLCPTFDRAFTALLDDLYDRGLIDQTLVVCKGEFGRTPKINGRAARDHWTNSYFSIWAGAGVQPGRVIGETDRLGQAPRSGPIVTPLRVGTTIAELAGVSTQARAEMRVLDGGTVVDELF